MKSKREILVGFLGVFIGAAISLWGNYIAKQYELVLQRESAWDFVFLELNLNQLKLEGIKKGTEANIKEINSSGSGKLAGNIHRPTPLLNRGLDILATQAITDLQAYQGQSILEYYAAVDVTNVGIKTLNTFSDNVTLTEHSRFWDAIKNISLDLFNQSNFNLERHKAAHEKALELRNKAVKDCEFYSSMAWGAFYIFIAGTAIFLFLLMKS